MAIASYEVVGSGGVWRSNTMASLWAATKPRNPPSRQPLLRRHWQFGKGTRSSFQYPGHASNPNRHREAKRAAGVTRAKTGSTSPIMSAHSRTPPKLIEHDLDNGQRSPGFLPLSNPHHQALARRVVPIA